MTRLLNGSTSDVWLQAQPDPHRQAVKALAEPCPRCRAPSGWWCVTKSGSETTLLHKERLLLSKYVPLTES